MNEWTNERMNEWTNERMNEWTNQFDLFYGLDRLEERDLNNSRETGSLNEYLPIREHARACKLNQHRVCSQRTPFLSPILRLDGCVWKQIKTIQSSLLSTKLKCMAYFIQLNETRLHLDPKCQDQRSPSNLPSFEPSLVPQRWDVIQSFSPFSMSILSGRDLPVVSSIRWGWNIGTYAPVI